MDFTKEQLSDVFIKHLNREKGLQELMELMIESMMQAERRDFLDANPDNKGNGFRQGKSYGNGRVETRITKGGIREINTSEKHELVTTHTARRSLATNLVLRGVSPYVVMKVTGHKSLSSFERYVRLQELEAMIELKSLSFFQ